MANDSIEPQEIFERLWADASDALNQGRPQLDPFLTNRSSDQRRCVTLAFRPSPDVQARVNEFLQAAAQAAPGQHVYQPDELHSTVLAVIPGSAEWRKSVPNLPLMRRLISEIFRGRNSFTVKYRGVTASPAAVIIQGFPSDNALEQLRDDLRSAFKQNNVSANIDKRYRIAGAHITAMRLANPLNDWKPLLNLLKANRTTDFGETRVTSVQLLFGDWYASAARCRVLESHPLV